MGFGGGVCSCDYDSVYCETNQNDCVASPAPPPPAPPESPPFSSPVGDPLSGPVGLNSELSNNIIKTEVTFQIVNFIADTKIKKKTPIIGFNTAGSLSNLSEAEIRGEEALGKENFEDNDAETIIVRGSLTATISNKNIIGESQLISFVAGSNIKLSTNESNNIIKISMDDLYLTELLDAPQDNTSFDGYKEYWLIRGTTGPEDELVGQWESHICKNSEGVSGYIGFDGYTGMAGGQYENGENSPGDIILPKGVLSVQSNQLDIGATGITFNPQAFHVDSFPLEYHPNYKYASWFSIGTGGSGSWGASGDTIVNITNGFTSGGTIDFYDNIIQEANILNASETISNGSSHVYIVDMDADNTQYITATGPPFSPPNCNIIFDNMPEPNQAGTFTLYIENGGLFENNYGCFCQGTTATPGSLLWASGAEPTLSTAGVDVVSFLTIDGGTSFYGIANGINFNS